MNPLTLLIVSNNVRLANYLQILLIDIGYQVQTTKHDEEEIHELYLEFPTDLMLIDMNINMDFLAINSAELPLLGIAITNTYAHSLDVFFKVLALPWPPKRQALKDAIEEGIKQFKIQQIQVQTKNAFATQKEICIKKRSVLYHGKIKDVLFIKADDNYVIIQTRSSRFIAHIKLSEIQQLLQQQKQFAKVHRSYLVNLSEATSINFKVGEIILGTYTVPISRRMKSLLKKQLVL